MQRGEQKPQPGVATHQKTQQGLKRERTGFERIDRSGRNASENPAGIETRILYIVPGSYQHVATHQKTQQGLKPQYAQWT